MVHESDTLPDEKDHDYGDEAATDAQRDPIPPRKPPQRPEPTRYGDWEKDGRCIDF
ncbi:DUF1674 domain-containing protein [Candidatus Methylocalor cossyra]|uniref:DUF1674 domain-containing protein n=1 Tax=Candidatus Methylocalor cossyra TaxID=3108543 RepID=A0ABM9NGB2_9GAMM